MNADLDYYRVLEVGTTATEGEIKKAYHKKALTCHPDRGGTEQQMKAINEAWAVLGDATTRNEYDSERTFAKGESSGSMATMTRPREGSAKITDNAKCKGARETNARQ